MKGSVYKEDFGSRIHWGRSYLHDFFLVQHTRGLVVW